MSCEQLSCGRCIREALIVPVLERYEQGDVAKS